MECVHQTINNSRFRNILTMTRYTRARISVFLVYLGKCPIKTRKSKKRKMSWLALAPTTSHVKIEFLKFLAQNLKGKINKCSIHHQRMGQ
jgi:hypothetical protein